MFRAEPSGRVYGTVLTFANTMEVDAGSSISADMQGYVATVGPGAGPRERRTAAATAERAEVRPPSTVYCSPNMSAYMLNLGSGGGSAGGTAGAGGGGILLYAREHSR
jgi:hypothetical protein